MVHINEGFDFLSYTIRRQRKRGTRKHYVYTKPSRKAVQAIRDKVRSKTYRSTRNLPVEAQIKGMNRLLSGWANYFRHGVSKDVFDSVDYHAWGRLMRWIRAKHAGKSTRLGMSEFRRRAATTVGGSPTKGSRSPARPASAFAATAVARSRPLGVRAEQPPLPSADDQRVRHVESPLR